MKRALLLCSILILAACKPTPPRAREPVPPPMDQIPDKPAPPITIKPSFQCPKPVVEGEPVLPLDAPLTELQKLICAQPELALLDRQVHEAYLAARLRPGVNRAALSKAEQQWSADLDSCLKAAEPRDCVAEASRTRLAQFVLQDPTTVARTQLEFTCQGTATPLTAAFYSRLRPAFAVLGFGSQQAIVFVEPSNAGLKYSRSGVDFFVRKGQVSAEFYGRTLACVSPTWRPTEPPSNTVADQDTDALIEHVSPQASLAAPPSPATVTATQVIDAPMEQVAPPRPSPAPATPSPVAKAPPAAVAAKATEAPVKPAAPSAPTRPVTWQPLPAAKVQTPVAARQPTNTPVAPRAAPKPSPVQSPAAKAPPAAVASSARNAPVKPAASRAPTTAVPVQPPPAAAKVQPTAATKQATDAPVAPRAQTKPALVQPPAATAPRAAVVAKPAVAADRPAAAPNKPAVSSAATTSPQAQAPAQPPRPAKVNMEAARATEALVRQVVAQAQGTSADAAAKPPASSTPVDAKP